jgi:holo-[acyl-carrier protein] synthase
MSVRGIGNDILLTSRIASFIEGHPTRLWRFARRILHPKYELPKLRDILSSADNVNNPRHVQAVRLLASTWAAKESLYKSLDAKEQQLCRFNHWYRHTQQDQRVLVCESYLQRHPGERFLLTVSHDGDYTTALVVRTESTVGSES